jgi:nitrogen fixation-related uncharacterized protein
MFKKVVTIFVIAIIISVFLISVNEQQFNQTDWRNNPTERYKMSKDIIESKFLVGKSKQDVILLLGEPKVSNFEGKDHSIYSLGKAPSFFESKDENLVVIYENDSVSKVIHSKG